MKEYHKIETLFERDPGTKKLVVGKFRNETVESLKDINWEFSEKVDGTNIRIHWDGHEVSIGGRTDKAQIPTNLLGRLTKLFLGEANAQLFEQKFGEAEVTLIGEGYGAGIQKGGNYKNEQDFILFDVRIGEIWLKREDVEEIANYFGIDVVPIVLTGTIDQAVEYVRSNPKSVIAQNGADMEGVVGRPKLELRDRLGRRIIVKIKWEDFK